MRAYFVAFLVIGATFGCAEGGENQNVAGAGGVAWTTAQTGGTGGAGATTATGGTSATGGSGAAPTVTSVDPADGTTAVAAGTTVSVTFSEAMDTATATSGDSTTCAGSLQLSTDGFSSCVAMTGLPSTSDNLTFALTPSAPLDSARVYQLRATDDLTNASGAFLVPFESTGFTTRYAHTIVIDGTKDFDPAEEIASSTSGAKILIGYDDTHLFLGLEHSDIVVGGTPPADKFVYFLLSTDPSLGTGNAISSDDKAQFGSSSARMMFHYKHQIDGGNYSEFRSANGTDWDTDWGTSGKTISKQTGYLEASIALSELGSNVTDILLTTFTIDYTGQGGDGHLYNMLPNGVEGTGVPARDLVQYVHIRLPTSTAPADASLLQTF